MIEFASDAEGQRAQLRAERAARGEPGLAPAEEWCVVGWRLETAGFAQGAADAWRQAVALAPALPRAHLGLGRTLLALKDPDGAAAPAPPALQAQAAPPAPGAQPPP